MKVENCVLTDLHWFVLLEVVDSTSDLHEITSFPLSLTTFLKCDMIGSPLALQLLQGCEGVFLTFASASFAAMIFETLSAD